MHGLSRLVVAVVAVTGLLGPLLGLASCRAGQPPNPSSIRIAIPPLEQNALIYVAESRGLFERYGLQVTIDNYDTGVETLHALLDGKADVAELAEFPFVEPVLEGHSIQILAVNDRFENDYLLVRRDQGITEPADLKGKRIGVIRGTILEFYLGRFLQIHGIDLDEVAVVDTATTTQTSDAMVNGALDAVVVFQPHAHAIQSRLGDDVMAWPVQSGQLVYGILASNTDWIAGNRDTVERFLKALAEAEDYMMAHPEKAQSIVERRLNLAPDYVASIWPLHQFALSLDFSLVIAMNDEARWLIENHLVAQQPIPNFRDHIYLDGLEAVKPEAVDIVR